jgi:hypothetical protein
VRNCSVRWFEGFSRFGERVWTSQSALLCLLVYSLSSGSVRLSQALSAPREP